MRILDLLDRAELGFSIVWAEPAMLERDITGSHIVEPTNPGTALSPGDLVLTDATWASDAASAEAFLAELAAKHVEVLVVGTAVVHEIPDFIVAACRSRGIVLLTVSRNTSLTAVSRHIESTIASAGGADAGRSATFTSALIDGIGSGIGAQGALRAFHEQFAIECWVLESGGAVAAATGSAPSVEAVAAVWNRMLGSPGGGAAVVDDRGRAASVLPIVTDTVLTIGYLVCAGDHRVWPPDLERVVRTLLLAVRVELELANNRREAEQAPAIEFVQHLIADTLSTGEASARLRLLGVDPQLPMTAIAAQVDDSDYPSRAVLDALTALVSADGRVLLGCDLGDEAVVLLSGAHITPDELIGLAAPSTHTQRALLGHRRLRIGVSERAPSLGQLSSAVGSARARMRSAVGDDTIVWSTRSTPRSYEALLALLPGRITSAFGHSLLSPLVDYDLRHGSDLVLTLRVFLDANGAWQQAAIELHIHVNTLRYRIGRIEELTQRDLSLMRDRVDLFLALATTTQPGH